MPLNYGQLKTFASKDLNIASSGNDGPLELHQYINLAGHALCNMRGWRWMNAAQTTLNITSGQAYINMPADFLGIQDIDLAQTGETIEIVSFEQWQKLKKESFQPSGYVAIMGSNRDADGVFTQRLFLYPTPGATVSGGVVLLYRKGWDEITSDEANTRQLGLPVFMEPLFLEVMRAVVYGYEEDGEGGVSQRLTALKQMSVYADAVAMDIKLIPVAMPVLPIGSISYEPNHNYQDLPT